MNERRMNNVQVAALFVNVSTAAVKAEMENEQPKADIWLESLRGTI